MKVQCTSSTAPHLSAGRTYTVVELYDDMTRVVDDGGAPALHPSASFHLIDDGLDQGWHQTVDSDGVVRCCPVGFPGAGFFEDLFNRDEAALALLQRAINLEHDERARLLSWFERDGKSSSGS